LGRALLQTDPENELPENQFVEIVDSFNFFTIFVPRKINFKPL